MICPPSGLNRPVWVLLDNPDAALHLANTLDGQKVTYLSDFRRNEKSTLTLHCEVLQPPHHPHTLPAIANTPGRIATDLKALTNLLVALEGYWEIESSLVPCLDMLSQQVTDLTDIDRIYVLAHALRRIFGYDYWHGKDDQDFGISFHVSSSFKKKKRKLCFRVDWHLILTTSFHSSIQQSNSYFMICYNTTPQ